jgi:hypothetical protein
MAMTAKVAVQRVLPNVWPEAASDEDRKEIDQMVKEFLDAFEADYKQKIEDRKKK